MLFFLIIFLWLVRTARAVLFWVWLWQLKEYRFDRMNAHLALKSGRQAILNIFNLTHWILFASFPLLIISESWRNIFVWLVLTVFSLEILKGIFEAKKRIFKRPRFTKKVLLISGAVFIFEIIIFLFYFIQIPLEKSLAGDINALAVITLLVLALSILLPFFIFSMVVLLKPITKIAKTHVIQKAKNKIAKYPNLIVIGITGSYGKTSAKEFLYTILSEKFHPVNILRTIKANTDIGVAKVILNELKPEHQIFIVEMGAYKRGEIKAICDIVKPKIGILTGINEQHLALFGSLENTVKAKFELIEVLPEDGLAIINNKLKVESEKFPPTADPPKAEKLQFKVQSLKFFSVNEKSDIHASDIKIEKDKIKFKIMSDEASENFEINLIGKQNVSNILACTAVAEHLGMNLKEISQAVKKIKPLKKTMSAFAGSLPAAGTGAKGGKIYLIDDTYNANPAGVLAALEYLENFGDNSGRKIILFPGIIELGPATKKVHQSLGKKMAEVCDLIIITKKDFAEYIVDGTKFIIQENPEKVYQILKKYLKSGDVVLFESRGMENVLEKLKRNIL
jgi:UDP-N-acetylmuramoyl-tripeptide--D-alanyl-D-alanine ligase